MYEEIGLSVEEIDAGAGFGLPSEPAAWRSCRGFLVLADISGFTEFVTNTELEHGPPMIAALLEEVIRRLAPPLEVHGIEGDAIFAAAPDGRVQPPATLFEVLRAGFEGFRERQRDLAADDTCACNACTSVGRLRLKMIAHHGSFLLHPVGNRAQVTSADVILAHRLLKNRVSADGDYALLTRAAVERMGIDPVGAGLSLHREHYQHFGEVECFVAALQVGTYDARGCES